MDHFVESIHQVSQSSVKFRAIFCKLKPLNRTSFGFQISLVKKDMLRLLASLRQFIAARETDLSVAQNSSINTHDIAARLGKGPALCTWPTKSIVPAHHT
ncbi:hypothetical protein FJTKL_13305 [Diaporthe vaccinii]|uniref:Uncharacterized protein n=1 Tax=Diaporthe vaccinii TaxID=105482 RepID=A0ABR4EB33_9PEZI